MKELILSFTTTFILFNICLPHNTFSQADALINTFISEVNLDTLINVVRAFSGEDSTALIVDNTSRKILIKNRSTPSGRRLAADYLAQKLEAAGLTPEFQFYPTGRNVYAVQEGTVHPDRIYIICGHYDSVAQYCAEDNASGVSLVLEAARIFSNYDFEHTIVYAFWDEEETGLLGSRAYAERAAQIDLNIAGVLNLETLAYDGNNNKACDIHSNGSAGSLALVDVLRSVRLDYDLNTRPSAYVTAPQTSDQVAFWAAGFPAVAFGGSLFSDPDDLSPYFHTSNDRINHFNLDYFHEMGKHAIAALATLAVPTGVTPTKEVGWPKDRSRIYPNPVGDLLTLEINGERSGPVHWAIFDLQGRQVLQSRTDKYALTNGRIIIPIGGLSRGIYLVRAYLGSHWTTFHRIVKQ